MFGSPARAHAAVLLTAVLLAFLGFLAYLAVPKQCTDATRYIHATTSKDQPDAEDAAAGQANATTGCSSSSAAAAAAGSSVELSMLRHLLPLTNFSSIKSADLLDAAAASVGHRGLRQLMQLHNKLFCASNLHLEPLPGSIGVPFGNATMYVYDNNDIVSNSIKGHGHGWDAAETQEMLWAIRQFPQTRQLLLGLMARRYDSPIPAKSVDPATMVPPDTPLVVDVGANVGWFMLNAAAARARVAAFEAMPANIALLRRSLCANPWLDERIALYGTGLSDESNTCHIMSGTDNKGDGVTLCDKDPAEAEKRAHNTPGYESRGTMTVRRLDTLLAEDVQLMKIDVEGWETHVLQGGEGLLQQHNVWYIMAECNTGMIGEEGGKQFIKFMDAHGYAASTSSFKGPFWSTEDIQAGKAACTNINLYCVKKEAVGNQQSTAAGVTTD